MLSYPILIAFLLPCLSDGQEMSQLTGQKFSDELERMDINGIGAPNLQVHVNQKTFTLSCMHNFLILGKFYFFITITM